jgi:hypothetical protein
MASLLMRLIRFGYHAERERGSASCKVSNMRIINPSISNIERKGLPKTFPLSNSKHFGSICKDIIAKTL